MKRYRPLRIEQLEDRFVPTTWGNPWPDASHLTLSFANDGTMVGDQVSSLYSTLNAIASPVVWQREIVRAFQTWAEQANINISVVSDGGQPFGTAGSPQGDSRFGDIRIAGYAMGGNSLILASPFDAGGGTWSGDVKLNLATNFGVNGAGTVDIYSAMLHEAGHVLGLDHSDDTASPMYHQYLGIRTGVTSSDVSELQAMYGTRLPDSFEGTTGNNNTATATPITLVQQLNGYLTATFPADVTTAADQDYYSFNTGLLTGSAFIKLRADGLSQLQGRVTVTRANGTVVASAVAVNPAGDLSLAVNGLLPLQTYFVRVDKAPGTAFGIGEYQLEVTRLPLVGFLTGTVLELLQSTMQPLVSLLAVEDAHANDNIATATVLPSLSASPQTPLDYAYRGKISDGADRDFYRIAVSNNSTILTALVWSTDFGLTPRVKVYDSQGQLVASQVLSIDGKTHVIQATVVPGADYYLEVQGASQSTGSYYLGANLGTTATPLNTFQSVQLAQSLPIDRLITVNRNALVAMMLSVQTANGTFAGVQLEVRKVGSGNLLLTHTASTAEPASVNMALRPGQYVFRYRAVPAAGQPWSVTMATLRGRVLDDPIGPRPNDTTQAPSGGVGSSEEDDTIEWTGNDEDNVDYFPSERDDTVVV